MSTPETQFRTRFTAIVIAVSLAVAGAVIALAVRNAAPADETPVVLTPEQAAAERRRTREIVTSCTTDMATQFHIHPVLAIMIDGEKRTIPANVGIDKGCMHPLHTHDDSGKLHVESPVKRDFTLGDFFAVWGMPFDKDRILDKTTDADHEIRLLVNGQLSQDYENLVLHDGDQIMIAYRKKAR